MRILLVNGRKDATKHPGGDTIQLLKTQEALQTLGVEAEIRRLDELDEVQGYDLAHLFNIQMPDAAWAAFNTLKNKGIETVLSPIYWDLYPFWFTSAAQERALWRQISRLGGKQIAGRLYVYWQRAKGPMLPWWRTQRRLLQSADRVLPNSLAEADLLQRSFILGTEFKQKVDVVPNAIDPKLYERQPQPSREFREKYDVHDFVLQVGTIHPVKNQLGLLRALYDLPMPIVFIGRPIESTTEYAQQCRSLATQRGNVHFVDRVPHEALPQVYALARVHVLPSWRETPGLVSMEAAASGCPVVSTSIGSASEYFGDLAWYCHPDDDDSIRTSVESAVHAPASTKLRQHILDEFTWNRAAQCTLSAYHRILN